MECLLTSSLKKVFFLQYSHCFQILEVAMGSNSLSLKEFSQCVHMQCGDSAVVVYTLIIETAQLQ